VSLYTRCVAGALFPLHEFLKGHTTVAVRRALERSQWSSRAELEAARAERLRAFLRRIHGSVPYYRRMFDELGIGPQAIGEIRDLDRLPFLTKELIRRHGDELRAADARDLTRFNTGGSSGEPLIFQLGKERVSHDVAAKWRATRWWDVDIGDREIVLWGSPIELGSQDRVKLLRDRLLRTRLLSAFEMSPARVREFAAIMRAFRPRMLFGYPSALAYIARCAEDWGLRLDDLGIRVAFVTSERLYDEQRSAIARVFGCAVANGYGGRDAGFIAHECPRGGMHITAEDIIVEIVDREGRPCAAGESGEVVVTHLATGDFPFVRYRTGDVASLGDEACPCGRGLPVLRAVEGRTTDFVVAADGTVMHGLALIYVLRERPEVAAFKIVQEDRDHTRVLVVPGTGYGEAVAGAIEAGLRQRLGTTVRISVEAVDEIPPERSGKHRYVVSHVSV
jgi:phenylacetate-CoA ligase